MYYPYLYGRAAELAAIAAASRDFGVPRQEIIPVIEPVVKEGGSLPRYVGQLTRRLAEVGAQKAVAYVVFNPHQGAFASARALTQWQNAVSTGTLSSAVVRPSLKVRRGVTTAQIQSFVAAYGGQTVGLVIADENSITAAQLAAQFGSADVHVFLLPGVDSGAYIAAFGIRRVVRVMDDFNAQERNADYAGTELFSAKHLAAGAAGFSDFAILPGSIRLGGGPIGAAVVHLTYSEVNGEIWVEHFVSDETDRAVGTFQSKLLEALDHLVLRLGQHPARFAPASPALVNFQSQQVTGTATSPSKSKELQIRHHLHTVARFQGI